MRKYLLLFLAFFGSWSMSVRAVSFSDINYWIGEGNVEAMLVIAWNDGKTPEALAWGYKGEEETTIVEMLNDVVKTDPRLFSLMRRQGGYTVDGLGFDLNGENTVALVVGGDTTYPKSNATGQFTATPNNFKKWECVDKEDHWNSPSVSEDGVWHCLARSESGNEAETEINKMPIQNRYTYIFYYDKPGSDTPDYANAVAVEPYIQEAVDYSQGIFFVNEDWYGWDNGTINFLTNDGRMFYRVFRRENPDEKLGVTTQFGTIYGEKFFLISKQAKSTEEESTGGRLVVADALSLEKIAAFDQIGGGDGRSFLGVDEKTGYIGSSSGVFVFDIENMKVGDVIEGTLNDEGLYSGQIGSMVRAGKYVFAAKQSEGVLVIDAENHTLQTTIELPSIATLVLGRDGNIWAADGNALVRINPVSFETWARSLPSGCRVADTWGAWNAGSLCAAYKSNLLYFADESKNKVVCYNIDTDELNASFFTLPDQDGEYVQMFYGAGLRVDPQTDNVVVTSTESGYLSHYMNNWIHIVDGTNGEQYETYFFSVVDEGDLLAAAEAAGVEQAVCSCPEKCAAGAVNTDCPVCSVNMGKCVGAEPEPEPAPEPEPEPEKPGNAGMILLVLAVMGIGGGAAWYFKIYRPKHQQADQPEEDDGEEYPDYDEFEDDGPPWDEEDETEEKEEIR